MADKVPTLIESALSNGGVRTVAVSDLAAGTTTPPHYHTDFSETFKLISGSLAVLIAPDMNPSNLVPKNLEVGETATVPRNTLHTFVTGNVDTVVEVVFEPGTIGFEQTFLIMRGTQADGTYEQFGTPQSEEGAMFLAILGELTNTVLVGETKSMIDDLYARRGAEIAERKAKLIEKYATSEKHMQAAGIKK